MRKTPVTLGVLSITFGALMAVGSASSLLLGPLFDKLSAFSRTLPGQTETARAQMEAAQALMRAEQGYTDVRSLVFVLMSIVLIVIGIGLYRRRAWARRAAIGWGAAALGVLVVDAALYFGWLHGHMLAVENAVYAAHGLATPAALPRAAQSAGFVFGLLLDAVYPLVLIALCGRASAANDFVSPTRAS